MRRLVLVTLAVAAFGAGAAPASATECTPKGCTTSCQGGLQVDPRTLTVTWSPVECYS